MESLLGSLSRNRSNNLSRSLEEAAKTAKELRKCDRGLAKEPAGQV
jgi:hypothetical protein